MKLVIGHAMLVEDVLKTVLFAKPARAAKNANVVHRLLTTVLCEAM